MSGVGRPDQSRHHTQDELRAVAERLCKLCGTLGVEAVIDHIGDHSALLAATAEACRQAQLIPQAQYLDYCANPYD
jgi:hypothetical protein